MVFTIYWTFPVWIKSIKLISGFSEKITTKEYKESFARYGKLGIGMIHRNNLQEVENAVEAALYLTRPDKRDGSYQRLKVSLPNMKAFGQSRPKN